MNVARRVMPVLIACFVLWLWPPKGMPPAPSGSGDAGAPALGGEAPAWHPLGVGASWEYDARGAGRAREGGDPKEHEGTFTREVVKRRSDGDLQVSESVDGRVEDTYLMRVTARGVELQGMSLDRRVTLFLPADFKPGATWQLSDTWRATADGEPEEVELPGLGPRPCLRVRYERFYDEKWTPKPDWQFDGYRWFCRGVGVVREDFRDLRRPRPDGSIELMATWEVRELRSFKAPEPVR